MSGEIQKQPNRSEIQSEKKETENLAEKAKNGDKKALEDFKKNIDNTADSTQKKMEQILSSDKNLQPLIYKFKTALKSYKEQAKNYLNINAANRLFDIALGIYDIDNTKLEEYTRKLKLIEVFGSNTEKTIQQDKTEYNQIKIPDNIIKDLKTESNLSDNEIKNIETNLKKINNNTTWYDINITGINIIEKQSDRVFLLGNAKKIVCDVPCEFEIKTDISTEKEEDCDIKKNSMILNPEKQGPIIAEKVLSNRNNLTLVDSIKYTPDQFSETNRTIICTAYALKGGQRCKVIFTLNSENEEPEIKELLNISEDLNKDQSLAEKFTKAEEIEAEKIKAKEIEAKKIQEQNINKSIKPEIKSGGNKDLNEAKKFKPTNKNTKNNKKNIIKDFKKIPEIKENNIKNADLSDDEIKDREKRVENILNLNKINKIGEINYIKSNKDVNNNFAKFECYTINPLNGDYEKAQITVGKYEQNYNGRDKIDLNSNIKFIKLDKKNLPPLLKEIEAKKDRVNNSLKINKITPIKITYISTNNNNETKFEGYGIQNNKRIKMESLVEKINNNLKIEYISNKELEPNLEEMFKEAEARIIKEKENNVKANTVYNVDNVLRNKENLGNYTELENKIITKIEKSFINSDKLIKQTIENINKIKENYNKIKESINDLLGEGNKVSTSFDEFKKIQYNILEIALNKSDKNPKTIIKALNKVNKNFIDLNEKLGTKEDADEYIDTGVLDFSGIVKSDEITPTFFMDLCHPNTSNADAYKILNYISSSEKPASNWYKVSGDLDYFKYTANILSSYGICPNSKTIDYQTSSKMRSKGSEVTVDDYIKAYKHEINLAITNKNIG